MTLLKRVRTLAAKIETTVGTDASLSASDGAFNAYDIMMQPSIDVTHRESQGCMDYLTSTSGARMGTCTFKTDIGWDGTVTLPQWATTLFPATGWVNSSGTFNTVAEVPGGSGGVKSLTIGCYMDGLLKKLTGAMGTWRMILPTGRPAYIEWTFTGVWNAPTDVAIITPTYPTDENPIRFASGTCSYNSDALKVEQVTIDAGNEISMVEDPTTASGYSHAVVTSRHPSISANPECSLVATRDTYGDWIGHTEAAFDLQLDGASTSTLDIDAPKAQIVNSQESERERRVTDEIEWRCQKNGATANQSVTVTFNEAA